MDEKINLYSHSRDRHLSGRTKPKHSNLGINAGGAIVIIIFVVLCLTIFSILSFAASYSDKKLADKTAAEYAKFNLAETSAEAMLFQLGQAVAKSADVPEVIGRMNTYFNMVEDFSLQKPDFSGDGFTAVWKYDDMHGLQVTIHIFKDAATDSLKYTIQSWTSVILGDLNYEQGIDVWNGEEITEAAP